MQFKRVKVALVAAAVAFGLAAASTATASAAAPANVKKGSLKGVSITVGSKDFTESIVLSKIVKHIVLHGGGKVVDKTNIKGSVTTREAMLKGNIDLYWEYTGTAFYNYLKKTGAAPAPKPLYDLVKREDAKNKVRWLPMTSFNNTYAFAITKENAKKYGISKLSEISKVPAAEQVWCVESEFQSRPDGWPGFKTKYSVGNVTEKVLDTGAIYAATDTGQCFFGEVFATDGRISALGLTVLADDRDYFPPYNAAITIREATAKKYPKLVTALNAVSARLTAPVMATLNARVDVLGESEDEVAKDFLRSIGYLK